MIHKSFEVKFQGNWIWVSFYHKCSWPDRLSDFGTTTFKHYLDGKLYAGLFEILEYNPDEIDKLIDKLKNVDRDNFSEFKLDLLTDLVEKLEKISEV